uniref:Uncharacterized protein n=1 Tax=Alexandrium monilatum TaxID=311494 RepID=A0A7S4T0Z6_9DINO|mmetsp:Transcript_24377/g.76917  ORF Transcript_24377/g.76917 Transcript_24377/m.76917 type:complete len:110 (-) Transcript_24377:114-443(-)
MHVVCINFTLVPAMASKLWPVSAVGGWVFLCAVRVYRALGCTRMLRPSTAFDQHLPGLRVFKVPGPSIALADSCTQGACVRAHAALRSSFGGRERPNKRQGHFNVFDIP